MVLQMEEYPTKFNFWIRERGAFYSVALSNVKLYERISVPMYYYDDDDENHIVDNDTLAIYSSLSETIHIGDATLTIDQVAADYIQTSFENGTDINISPNIDSESILLLDVLCIGFFGLLFFRCINWMYHQIKKCYQKRTRITRHTDEDTMCTICLEDVEYGTKAVTLECRHAFHPDCITPWIEENNRCPNCNQTTSI